MLRKKERLVANPGALKQTKVLSYIHCRYTMGQKQNWCRQDFGILGIFVNVYVFLLL